MLESGLKYHCDEKRQLSGCVAKLEARYVNEKLSHLSLVAQQNYKVHNHYARVCPTFQTTSVWKWDAEQ